MMAALAPPLAAAWDGAWTALARAAPAESLRELLDRYAEPHRAYHTLQHLGECFATLEDVASLAERLDEVRLALWYHDAVYDTRAHDNEERSGALARAAVLSVGGGEEAAERVHALVLATKHTTAPAPRGDARLVVDVDLAILGAPPARFAEYEAQIRREYAWVPEAEFRARRQRVLRSFLERPSIYATTVLRRRLEPRARENLARSLDALAATSRA